MWRARATAKKGKTGDRHGSHLAGVSGEHEVVSYLSVDGDDGGLAGAKRGDVGHPIPRVDGAVVA